MPRILTYNVHRCVGVDRRLDVDRVAAVIAEHEPDIVCLQELDVGRARTGHVDQAQAIADRLAAGDAIVLFAEGTTSDGNRVLPFRSSLFGAVHAAIAGSPADAVSVQPVAIAYCRLEGIPLGRADRPLLAWIGDEDLAPHFKRLIGAGGFDVTVRFGEPIAFDAGTDRKRVASAAEAAVRAMHREELDGGRA